MPSPRSRASAKPSASKPSEPTVPAAPPIDKKKSYNNYSELMAAVRAYCLAEYQRRWGEPWDGRWKETKEHILAMQEAAQRGQRIWEKLHLAVEEAICFVEDQGLHVLEASDLLKVTGTVPYEAIVIHGWLNRHWSAITRLLDAQDFEPTLSIRSELASLLELQRVEEPATPGVFRWNYRGRPLKDEDMAIISLLVENEPSRIRKKLQDEALTIRDVVAMEREAINAALHRHGESKRVAKERRAQAAAHSVKRPAGGSVRAANPKRRAKAGRQA